MSSDGGKFTTETDDAIQESPKFNCRDWMEALQKSFCECVSTTMRDFCEELRGDSSFSPVLLTTAIQSAEQKMLASVKVNVDRLENFHNENCANVDGRYDELLRRIERRVAQDANYQTRVDAVFSQIQTSCSEFNQKKQKYLRYCLYDKYLEKERALVQSEGNGEYFDVCVREEQIHTKAKQDKEFLKDFGAYVDLFGNMQTELLRRIQ